MSWYDALLPLGAIAKSLASIDQSLQRLADVSEGKLPPAVEVPELDPGPATLGPVQTDAGFAQIEQIENRYLAISGRLPTVEEIVRELDGEEIPVDVSQAAMEKRLRVPGQIDPYGD